MIRACRGERDFPGLEHWEQKGVRETQVDNCGSGSSDLRESSELPGRIKESEARLGSLPKVGGRGNNFSR